MSKKKLSGVRVGDLMFRAQRDPQARVELEAIKSQVSEDAMDGAMSLDLARAALAAPPDAARPAE